MDNLAYNARGVKYQIENLGTWTAESLMSGIDFPPEMEQHRQELLQELKEHDKSFERQRRGKKRNEGKTH